MSASRTRIVCLPFGYFNEPSDSVLSSPARGILNTMSRSSESTTTSITRSASNIGPLPPGVQAHRPQHRGRRLYPRPAASNLFSYPDLLSKLAKNPKTAPLLSGPAFAFKLRALQANPRDMGERSSPGIERPGCRGERARVCEHARQDFGGAQSAVERGEQ
ncbi:unnamed protein product [Tilletia laevis]|uniref:STI1/HOP DP domain-containing protein n=1 Tax=Tilletia laevis TaxID=157183 RepID=A0A9N8M3J5_9BASI|nr:unnamed protein product [Tilletia caries]CAD6900414.1 unnamed protein product [Tilletia controversa]CAD6928557.1 unnamed protein product [Tilletia laevis]CAD6927594.1 unnamed protein product [Tilletia controversa]CAD6943558.1 unnamed protein product [Tilletia laevis]